MSAGIRGSKVLHTLSTSSTGTKARAAILACITSDHVITRRQTLMHRTVLQPVAHTLYTIVSSIVLNIIETDFRTNVRFRILVRHGRLSEKLISVVGQMSVSDKCPRILLPQEGVAIRK